MVSIIGRAVAAATLLCALGGAAVTGFGASADRTGPSGVVHSVHAVAGGALPDGHIDGG